MEISNKFLHPSNLLLSPYSSQFSFSSNILKTPSFLQPLNPKWCLNPKKLILCSISSSNSMNYGGWEDLKLIEDSNHSSKFNQFQHFLVSVGIDDRKHVFMFILGFISALAISRVRVSSILVFPASVLVFAVGFSLGFVRQGGMKDIGSKKTPKEENFRFSVEKLRNWVELFSEMGVKVTNLEKEMRGDLELDSVQVGEFENYCNVIKSVGLNIVEVKNLVEVSIKDMGSFVSVGELKGESFDDRQAERDLNQKLSRRKRESGTSYFDIFQFMGGLFQENASVAKPNKVKDFAKRESVEPLNSNTTNNESNNSVSVERNEQVKAINSESESNLANNVPKASRNEAFSQHIAAASVNGAGKAEVIQGPVNGNSSTMVKDIQTLSSNEEVSHRNYGSEFMNNKRNFMEMGHQNGKDMFMPRDNLYAPLDLGVNMRSYETNTRPFTMESKTSVQQEESLGESNGYNLRSYRRKIGENRSYKFDFIERREKSADPPNSANQQTAGDLEEDSASSPSSVISEDLLFSKHLTEATDLLKEARECLKGKSDEDRAEIMLHKSARLLSRAAAMKPMSLLAIGQLGNTFLLHGELKLRLSRELRTLLSKNDSSRGKSNIALKVLDEQNMSRDRIASILVDVCEECEGLLVEAGRQYRMALSIDGNDVRALYNWGLALSYRAQLIADVGPEAASDADRVYLAAIDKFNAMISRNKAYAPDALFRWGVALQQRSRLRPSNAKEKKKLLHQAKSLFEDALHMDSNNVKVREALSSCISELKYRHF